MKAPTSIYTFLVERRNLLLGFMLAVAVLCGLMVPRVNVNTDMTRYLPADSEMKQGLDRMTQALGPNTIDMLSVRAMYQGLTASQRDSLAAVFRQMEDVRALTAVQEKEGYVLYDLAIVPDGDPKAVATLIKDGSLPVVVETSIDGNLPSPIVIIIAALLVFAVLFLMCESWVEPLLYLATIGVAVVLNVGSNVLLESVSMTTNAIVAILQLVLSIDYSIILMNRYRQEIAAAGADADRTEAMKRALKAASPSVLSSAMTTMAGLLVLCLMKFRIGMDLGVVLAKGVLCSVVCLYTVLPSLILLFHSLIWRTHKRVPLPHTDSLARFEMRHRWPLAVVSVAVFVGSILLQNLTTISFSTNYDTPITQRFPRKNTVVLLYQNQDEDKIIGLADMLGLDAKVDTVVSYPTLMRRQLTSREMYANIKGLASMLDPEAATMVNSVLTPEMLDMVYQLRQHDELEDSALAVEVGEINQIASIAEGSGSLPIVTVAAGQSVGAVAPVVSVAPTAQLDTMAKPVTDNIPSVTAVSAMGNRPTYRDTILSPMTASVLAAYLGFEVKQASALYRMAGRGKGTMSPLEFVRYVNDQILPNRMYASFISKEQKRQLVALRRHMEEALQAPEPVVAEVRDTLVANTSDTLPVADTMTALPHLDTLHHADTLPATHPTGAGELPSTHMAEVVTPVINETNIPIDSTCSLEELVDFLTVDLLEDPVLSAFVDDTMRSRLSGVRGMMQQGIGQLKGDGWSMAAIVTGYADEGEEMQQFLERLRQSCDDQLTGEYSLVGESVMFDEMRRGFGGELRLITILTILVILLIVALTFRSLVVPVILVLTVLTGVYINVFVSGLGGRTLLYLAYLIVQSILMGATIDYAILFSNYYREGRRTQGVGESLKAAYRGSIRTIMTSGLIIVLAPGIMSLLVEDHTISAIVGCLAVGGLSAIILILFVLPGCLAACDRWVKGKSSGPSR